MKKLLSLLLVVSMLIVMVPASVFADEEVKKNLTLVTVTDNLSFGVGHDINLDKKVAEKLKDNYEVTFRHCIFADLNSIPVKKYGLLHPYSLQCVLDPTFQETNTLRNDWTNNVVKTADLIIYDLGAEALTQEYFWKAFEAILADPDNAKLSDLGMDLDLLMSKLGDTSAYKTQIESFKAAFSKVLESYTFEYNDPLYEKLFNLALYVFLDNTICFDRNIAKIFEIAHNEALGDPAMVLVGIPTFKGTNVKEFDIGERTIKKTGNVVTSIEPTTAKFDTYLVHNIIAGLINEYRKNVSPFAEKYLFASTNGFANYLVNNEFTEFYSKKTDSISNAFANPEVTAKLYNYTQAKAQMNAALKHYGEGLTDKTVQLTLKATTFIGNLNQIRQQFDDNMSFFKEDMKSSLDKVIEIRDYIKESADETRKINEDIFKDAATKIKADLEAFFDIFFTPSWKL